tara:strand:- start:25544 stop:25765 length:222 start_codon:yes stop_codon:yes gene_type:complete
MRSKFDLWQIVWISRGTLCFFACSGSRMNQFTCSQLSVNILTIAFAQLPLPSSAILIFGEIILSILELMLGGL